MIKWTPHNSHYNKLTSKDGSQTILLQNSEPQCKQLLVSHLRFKKRKTAIKTAQIIIRLIDNG